MPTFLRLSYTTFRGSVRALAPKQQKKVEGWWTKEPPVVQINELNHLKWTHDPNLVTNGKTKLTLPSQTADKLYAKLEKSEELTDKEWESIQKPGKIEEQYIEHNGKYYVPYAEVLIPTHNFLNMMLWDNDNWSTALRLKDIKLAVLRFDDIPEKLPNHPSHSEKMLMKAWPHVDQINAFLSKSNAVKAKILCEILMQRGNQTPANMFFSAYTACLFFAFPSEHSYYKKSVLANYPVKKNTASEWEAPTVFILRAIPSDKDFFQIYKDFAQHMKRLNHRTKHTLLKKFKRALAPDFDKLPPNANVIKTITDGNTKYFFYGNMNPFRLIPEHLNAWTETFQPAKGTPAFHLAKEEAPTDHIYYLKLHPDSQKPSSFIGGEGGHNGNDYFNMKHIVCAPTNLYLQDEGLQMDDDNIRWREYEIEWNEYKPQNNKPTLYRIKGTNNWVPDTLLIPVLWEPEVTKPDDKTPTIVLTASASSEAFGTINDRKSVDAMYMALERPRHDELLQHPVFPLKDNDLYRSKSFQVSKPTVIDLEEVGNGNEAYTFARNHANDQFTNVRWT